MDARDGQRAAAVERLQRGQHQVADRREQDRGVQWHRWPIGGALRRRRAQRQRQFAGGGAPRHHMHLGTLRQRDLRGDVCAAAEPVDAQPSAGGQVGPQQRAIADDAGAQQRRQLDVGVPRWQRVRESGWDRGEFGVAAVGVPAGVARLRAEILLAAHTELALPAGMAQPGDADTIADLEIAAGVRAHRDDLANDFVSGHDGGPVHRQVAFGDVQVGAAHAAGVHGDKELAVPGRGTSTVTRSSGWVLIGPGRRTCHAFIDSAVMPPWWRAAATPAEGRATR